MALSTCCLMDTSKNIDAAQARALRRLRCAARGVTSSGVGTSRAVGCLRSLDFLSIVTLCGTQARQGLARSGGKNSGPFGAKSPLNEQAPIPRESGPSRPPGGSRFAA